MLEKQKEGQLPIGYPVYSHPDEISLAEIFLIIKKQWLLIALTIFLVLALAALYLAVMPSIYESRAVISVGQIGGIQGVSGQQPIELPKDLVKRLSEEYQIDLKSRPELPRVEKVLVDGKSIELIARGFTPEDAQSLLSSVVAKVLVEHNQTYNRAISLLSEKITQLSEVVSTIDASLVEIDRQVSQLTDQDTSAAALFTLEKSRLLDQSSAAQERITNAEIAQELQSQPSEILSEATLNDAIVSPKRKLIVLMSLVFGLFLGVIVAFLFEYVGSVKRETKSLS